MFGGVLKKGKQLGGDLQILARRLLGGVMKNPNLGGVVKKPPTGGQFQPGMIMVAAL